MGLKEHLLIGINGYGVLASYVVRSGGFFYTKARQGLRNVSYVLTTLTQIMGGNLLRSHLGSPISILFRATYLFAYEKMISFIQWHPGDILPSIGWWWHRLRGDVYSLGRWFTIRMVLGMTTDWKT